jgi:hypothetical protein
MGYRSDVEILFYPQSPEDFAMLKLYVDENLPDEFEVGDIPPAHIWPQGNKYLHLRIEGTKWYPSFDEVTVYYTTFENWENVFGSPPKCHYEFLRIGEDDTDTESSYSDGAQYALRAQRTITLEF